MIKKILNSGIDIYIARVFSSVVLFTLLSIANLWLSPIANTALALGYRLFILLTPFLFLLFRHKITIASFVILEIGLFALLFNFTILGIIMFAIGIATSGYMLKYYASFTTKGAANNKMAFNIGNMLAGALILATEDKTLILLFSIFIIFISIITFLKFYIRNNISNFKSEPKHFSFKGIFTKIGFIWSLVGFIIGIKFIAIVSILPQILIKTHNGILPSWFGIMLFFNNFFIILFQAGVMKNIANLTFIRSIIPLTIAMIVIAFSGFLGVGTIIGALIWTIMLAATEATISYLDKLSQDDHCLFIKEIATGIGCATTVFFVRFFEPEIGSLSIGLIGIFMIISAILIKNRI